MTWGCSLSTGSGPRPWNVKPERSSTRLEKRIADWKPTPVRTFEEQLEELKKSKGERALIVAARRAEKALFQVPLKCVKDSGKKGMTLGAPYILPLAARAAWSVYLWI